MAWMSRVSLRRDAHDDQSPHRNHESAADALQHAEGDELVERPRDAAEERGEGEDEDRGGKDVPRAEAVRHPAAGRDEDGKRQQIGADAGVEINRRDAEIGSHMRNGGRDDGGVQIFHEERARHEQRDRIIGCSRRFRDHCHLLPDLGWLVFVDFGFRH